MKRKLLVALLCALVVFTLSPFTVAAKQYDNEKCKQFTADAEITQTYTSGWLPDEKYNDGIHFKTIGEELVGEITQCNWDTLDEAVITMVNDSYYTVDFTTGYMEGNSYSTITITTKDEKGSVTFKAAGPMSGTYPLPGVDAQMKVIPRSIKGVGSLAFITPKQIIANFYWTDTGYGTGTITGHYKDIDKNKNN